MVRLIVVQAGAAVLGAILVSHALPAAAQSRSAIFIMDADGAEATKASHQESMWLGSPSWSHDGKKLLYGGVDPQGQVHLYLETFGEDGVVDLGGGDAPCWSPDDTQITFSQQARNTFGKRPGVWVMNVDGSGQEWISDGRRPRWSPDGDRIVFASDHEGFESLYVYDTVALTQFRVLERKYDQIIGGSWSPDNRRVVFVGYKGGRFGQSRQADLAVVDADEKQTPDVLYQGYVGWQPDWSPDGKTIVFWIREGEEERLQLLDIESGEPPRPLPNQFTSRNSDPVWSPDGKKIAFSSDR